MKRRTLGVMVASALVSAKLRNAMAADSSLLTTTLTPFGSERAGNADGSIPAWTGGYTQLPPGWQPGQAMPDFFASEQPVATISADNVSQHADRLSEGTVALIQKYGLSIKVFPTHRTAMAPQWVYDNIAANAGTAQLDARGGRFGFTGAWGGVPFPITNAADPVAAGSQIMWNHSSRWNGRYTRVNNSSYVVSSGSMVLASTVQSQICYPYYISEAGKDWVIKYSANVIAPPNLAGSESLSWYNTDGPTQAWEVLSGQGRVRMAPEYAYDTPSPFTDGVSGYDEYYGFNGAHDRYDWRYIANKEMYIPYNNNGLALATAEDAHLVHFLNPDVVRWELHRVWIVEATLHQGERNVLPKRRFYIDEDTWMVGVNEAWDANGNLFKVGMNYNLVRPDLPGVINLNTSVHNLQTGDFVTLGGIWNQQADPVLKFADSIPAEVFDSENLAAAAQY